MGGRMGWMIGSYEFCFKSHVLRVSVMGARQSHGIAYYCSDGKVTAWEVHISDGRSRHGRCILAMEFRRKIFLVFNA